MHAPGQAWTAPRGRGDRAGSDALRPLRLALAVLAALLLWGCGSMLPRGSSDTPSAFETYAQAQAAAEQVVPALFSPAC